MQFVTCLSLSCWVGHHSTTFEFGSRINHLNSPSQRRSRWKTQNCQVHFLAPTFNQILWSSKELEWIVPRVCEPRRGVHFFYVHPDTWENDPIWPNSFKWVGNHQLGSHCFLSLRVTWNFVGQNCFSNNHGSVEIGFVKKTTLPETNIFAPENGRLEY